MQTDNCRNSENRLLKALPKAYAKFRMITDSTGKPEDFIFIQVNEACEQLMEITRKTVLEKRFTEVFPHALHDGSCWISAFGKAAQEGEHIVFEQYDDPQARWYEVTVFSDEPGHVSALIDDITGRKKHDDLLQKQNNKLALLLEVISAIEQEKEPHKLSQIIVNSMARLTEMNSVAIYMITESRLRLESTYPPLPEDFPEFLRLADRADHPHIDKAITTKVPVVLPDTRKAELTPAEQEVCDIRNLRSILYVPLIYQNQCIGIMIPSSEEVVYDFDEETIKLSQILAGQAALSIVEARHAEEQKLYIEEIEQKNRELKLAEETVKNSESRLADILRYAESVAFITTDAQTDYPRITDFSPGAEKIFGYAKEEVLGKHVGILHILEDVEKFPDTMQAMRSRQGGFSGEAVLVRKNGERFPALFKTYPLYGDDGIMRGTIGVSVDITEQKQAQESLTKSEEKHRRLFETMSQGIIYMDREGRIFSANPAAERILGMSVKQMLEGVSSDIRWSMVDENGIFVEPDDRPVAKALRTGEMSGPVIGGIHRPGSDSITWLSITAIPLFRPGEKKPYQAYATLEDITQRRQAEENLHHVGERYQALLYHSPLLISEFDFSGRYLMGNTSVSRLFSMDPDELAGKTLQDLLPHDIAESFMERIREIKETQEPKTVYDYIELDGEKRFYSTTLFPLYDPSGMLKSVGTIAHDITEVVKAQEEKDKLQKQLLQAQKMEAVGQLAGGIAHDFNNMLSVILGYSDMVMDKLSPSDPVLDELREMHAAANRSAELTRQLLAFARKQAVEPKIVDMNQVISGMTAMLHRLIGEDIELSWIPGENLDPVLIDPSQIDQVLVNLCVNARDAIHDTGKIIIETSRVTLTEAYGFGQLDFTPGEYIMIAVSDDGSGMDSETLAHSMEPFFTTKSPGKGTGLGLPTVFGIVKQNKGLINVYSEPGQGTSVKIYLPVTELRQEAQASSIEHASGSCGGESILLVDDDVMVRTLTAKMLQQLGYEVLTASLPNDALGLCSEHGEIALLLTDVIMPDMNGKKLYEMLQAECPQLKCLYMSGYTSNVIVHRGIVDDGVKFLQKPFTKKSLSMKIRDVLDA